MNFFGALFGLVLTTLIILPIIMLAGVVTYHWFPIFLFLMWLMIGLMRGKMF